MFMSVPVNGGKRKDNEHHDNRLDKCEARVCMLLSAVYQLMLYNLYIVCKAYCSNVAHDLLVNVVFGE